VFSRAVKTIEKALNKPPKTAFLFFVFQERGVILNTFHSGKILEFANFGYSIKKNRGSLEVFKDQKPIALVPFDDIQAIIFSSPDLHYTHNLIIELSSRKIPIIFCDETYSPFSIVLPFDAHYHSSRRRLFQAQASKPVNKRLWKQIIVSKIKQQQIALEQAGLEDGFLSNLSKQVRSDDSTNCESQAARYYFGRLFGNDFKRDRNALGLNSMLNYGYTVMRSAMARAVVAAGLSPGIGIKHCNPNNSMPLVDDLLEPFRPLVDIFVYEICLNEGQYELDIYNKKRLISILNISVESDAVKTTPTQIMHRLTASLADIYSGGKKELNLPLMVISDTC
jgi:CRISP-associated protein Cas1